MSVDSRHRYYASNPWLHSYLTFSPHVFRAQASPDISERFAEMPAEQKVRFEAGLGTTVHAYWRSWTGFSAIESMH